ncbi:hypothetical protein [Peptoniphilus sp. oral taxon 386]|uniref:hypothetical protein n=1 Tax=Peptoniphilus sp. oral taxon 386 TaxID=652713 RepID=UPI0001DA99FE|nr:hypothetical protein [Peptoniphilus sp. oral taxon 386]EFI41816.1 hypothetical protein HMPREF0629_00444 [Peptoniphilus sp. oral taxon 386 str. F0131]
MYKSMLDTYRVSEILVTGSSSGTTLALGLVSHINAMHKDIENQVGKICLNITNDFPAF